jgi:hypothetical protein
MASALGARARGKIKATLEDNPMRRSLKKAVRITGRYAYICAAYPDVKGTLIVE